MFNNLSYKRKNRLLLTGSVLFAFIVYQLAVKNTITLYSEYSNLKSELSMIESAPQQVKQYEKRLEKLNSGLLHYAGTEGQQEKLLETVSSFCRTNNLTLKEFPSPTLTPGEDYAIQTNTITIEGPFTKIVKLVYELEQKQRAGRVASLQFARTRPDRQKSVNLRATIYLQNIKKSKNETNMFANKHKEP